MTEAAKSLDFSLTDPQLVMHSDPSRFIVCVAGRRFGKSHFAAVKLILGALNSPLDVAYVAPTFGQAKKIMWDVLIEMSGPVLDSFHINDGWIKLINGRKIFLEGADRPDTMRGLARSLYVLDEFGDMKPEVWEQIVRPQLSDAKGSAIFIGTPKGRNHFYTLAKSAELGFENPDTGERIKDPEWAYYHWTTFDNPYIDIDEIRAAKNTMSDFAFRQEYLASFEAAASEIFNPNHFYITEDEPKGGQYYITVDLAGFAESSDSKLALRDEHAICITKVTPDGKWWVKEILHGRWPIRETALRLVKAVRDYRP